MSEAKVIANQNTIIKNQKAIIANQSALKANQTTIKKNQASILKNQAGILKNQGTLSTIVENQKEILARLNKRFAHQRVGSSFSRTGRSRRLRGAGPGKNDGLGRNNPFAFFHRDELIRHNVSDRILLAAGPDNFQAHHLASSRFAQAEGQRQLALGQIT